MIESPIFSTSKKEKRWIYAFPQKISAKWMQKASDGIWTWSTNSTFFIDDHYATHTFYKIKIGTAKKRYSRSTY